MEFRSNDDGEKEVPSDQTGTNPDKIPGTDRAAAGVEGVHGSMGAPFGWSGREWAGVEATNSSNSGPRATLGTWD